LILALACQKAFFEVGEIVYNAHDEVANVFLVLSGTFAHVAHASPDGGRNYRGGGLDCRRINTSRAILETKRSMSSAALAEVHKILQPYSLFSHRSYFGEVEIFLDCMRKTTARCESQSGCLLVIHKSEFRQVAQDFPQFGVLWKQAAIRHDRMQKIHKAQLKVEQTFEHLAASLIQRFVRSMIKAGRSSQGRSQQPGASQIAGNVANLEAINDDSDESDVDTKIRGQRISELRSDVASLHTKLDTVLRALRI
jgi:CRP-like cAMP-binding protein